MIDEEQVLARSPRLTNNTEPRRIACKTLDGACDARARDGVFPVQHARQCRGGWRAVVVFFFSWGWGVGGTYVPYCEEDERDAEDQRQHVAEGSEGEHSFDGKRLLIPRRSAIPPTNM